MLCPKCGYFSREQDEYCLRCNHPLNRQFSNKLVSANRAVLFTPNFLRIVIYAGLAVFLFMLFRMLYSRYLEAKDSLIESTMLSQALEHKKMILQLEKKLDRD